MNAQGKIITSAFSLPETMAFILTNSVENSNGITNINNTINIYNSAGVSNSNKQRGMNMSQFSSKQSASSKIPSNAVSKPPSGKL